MFLLSCRLECEEEDSQLVTIKDRRAQFYINDIATLNKKTLWLGLQYVIDVRRNFFSALTFSICQIICFLFTGIKILRLLTETQLQLYVLTYGLKNRTLYDLDAV